MGVDITYECIGPCTYRIYHRAYYDCGGQATFTPVATSVPFSPGNDVDISGGLGCGSPTQLGGWQFESYTEVSPICPGTITACNSTNGSSPSGVNGVAEGVYYADFNFCNVNCTNYTISWSSCCRNYAITSPAGGDGIYTGVTQIDLSFSPCNSSPQFTNPPVPYICAGQSFTFNQGAVDPDGDSLSYVLGPCMSDPGVQVGYGGGYTPTQPLGSSWNVTIDATTGDITMAPNPTGAMVVGVMCVLVQEWRNGTLIGQVVRDMQVTVLPCSFTAPTSPGVTNVSGAQIMSPTQVRGCVGTPICFDLPSVNTDPSVTLTMSWDNNIQDGIFSDAANPSVWDTIVGTEPTAQFCWTPTAPGQYSYLVTIVDDNCPIPGFNQFTIEVIVPAGIPNPQVAVATPVTGCNTYEFLAATDSAAEVFDYQWSGSGNLNTNPGVLDSFFVHTYPGPGRYFYDLLITDSLGCQSRFNDTLDVQGITADAGPEISICSDFSLDIGEGVSQQNFTYSWSPGTGLNDPTAVTPTFSLTNNGSTPDTIDYVLTVQDTLCTAIDYTRVIVYPTPTVSVSASTNTICEGETSILTAVGGTNYQWNTGDFGASITVNPDSTTTYSVVSYNDGCSSIPDETTISVNYGPEAEILGTFNVCPGEDAVLTAIGAPVTDWSTGASTASITLNQLPGDTMVYMVPTDNGCVGDTIFANITAYEKPTADYSATTVCSGDPMSFTDMSNATSTDISEWAWDFNDPVSGALNTSTDQNPSHVFNAPGTYNVQLISSTPSGCSDTISQTVTVTPVPNADFTFVNICDGESMQFTDASSILAGGTITSHSWEFGDGNVSTDINPTHTYGTFGYFDVVLTVTSDNGCVSTHNKTIFVHPNPIASFNAFNVCEDKVMYLASTSTVDEPFDYLATWEWNFDDPTSGPNNTSGETYPTHIYANPGTYTPSLIVTTGNGCKDTFEMEMTIYPDPQADFYYDNNCIHQTIRFHEISQHDPGTDIVGWNWAFGDGVNSELISPGHKYTNGPGEYMATLIVTTTEGCTDTITKSVFANPRPEPAFSRTTECFGDATEFTNGSTIDYGSIISYSWDFGDGVGTSTDISPTYTYAEPGLYSTILTAVSDSGCTNTTYKIVTVHELPPDPINHNDSICLGDNAFLLVEAPQDIEILWYDSETGGSPFNTGNSYVTPNLALDQTYYITTVSARQCSSARAPISALVFSEESVQMQVSDTEVFLPLALVEYTSTSNIPIATWNWDFGDGNTSIEPEPAHQYQYPGVFNVQLTVTDENGCPAEISTELEVKRIVGIFVPSAFSPNGDGYNDLLTIGHSGITQFQMQVFDRWGKLIYETDNPDFEWTGISQNKSRPVPDGVYVFVVKALSFDGNEYEEKGTITIIR